LGDYSLFDLFSSIHSSLLAQGEGESGSGKERNKYIRRTPLKTVYLNDLRLRPLQSEEGLDYWNKFITTAKEWSTIFEENYGVTVLARSVAAMERDSMFRYVDPTISNFRPVVQLIENLFQDWMQDLQRMLAYDQSVSDNQKELDAPVTSKKASVSGGFEPQCVSMSQYV
jgi:hypothetical protein